jgi:hypothetical protein
MIFSAIDVQRGRLHLLFGHHKQWGPPTKTARKPTFNVLDMPLYPNMIESFLNEINAPNFFPICLSMIVKFAQIENHNYHDSSYMCFSTPK